MAGISLKNVNKVFPNGFEAVKDVSLDITDKEFVVFVGPSGCGKTTLLRMISGLEELTNGEIFIGDKLMNDVEPKDRDIAMVFQNYALYPHLTVYKNMTFGLSMRKYPKAEIEKHIIEAAHMLEIEHLLERKPKQLSGGERQRVAMGRAIVRDPAAFLMDEPLSNLDAQLRGQMRAEVSKLHQKLQTTFVYVTHDQTEAMTLGDRIVVMKDGEIQQADTPQNVYKHPANMFVAGFIGSPGMNFFEIQLSGKTVIAGLRPQDIRLGNGVSAYVELVEDLGAEKYVHLRTENDRFIAKVEADVEVKVGDVLDVMLDFDKANLFDKESGDAITHDIDFVKTPLKHERRH